MTVTKLSVIKPPTTPTEVREEIVAMLERTLEEAKRGDVCEMLLVIEHPNDEWSNRSCYTSSIRKWLGTLEVVKYNWIQVLKGVE